jgi:hypothetical protein
MACVLHVYIDLCGASESVVGVAEQDPAVVILATEVRVQACKGGVAIRGIKVTQRVRACGLVMPPDLAVMTEEDLVPDPIIVWGRKGIRKLPILKW